MAWWGWLLLAWVVLSPVVGVVVGTAIRAADRRDAGRDHLEEAIGRVERDVA